MEKNLKLYIYNGVGENISPTPFPDNKEQVEITSFDYNAKRMGDAPSINATFMYPICLDNEWSENVYVEFNGEKYFLHHTPTSSKSNTDARYKYDVTFVSERRALNDVYLFNVVSADAEDIAPVTNSTRFEFNGTIWDLAQRINQSLENSKVNYRVNIPTDKEVAGYITNEYKAISFSDTYVANALQEFYNTFEVPYYFDGREIHLGNKGTYTLTEVFEYGAKNALLSISKNNANYKIVNRITGTGSSENIPYYYPNTTPMGFVNFYRERGTDKTLIDDVVSIVDTERFNAKFRLSTKLKYQNYTGTKNDISTYKDEEYKKASLAKTEQNGKWDIGYVDIEIRFDITEPTENGEHIIQIVLDNEAFNLLKTDKGSLGATLYYQKGTEGDGEKEDVLYGSNGWKKKFRVVSEDGEVFKDYVGEKTFLHADSYQVNISLFFSCDNKNDVNNIANRLKENQSIKIRVAESTQEIGWFDNDKLTTLESFGISYSETPENGDVIFAEQDDTKGEKIPNSTALMPSIYRKSGGAERFYSAIDASKIEEIEYDVKDAYIDPSKGNGEYYTFSNLYNGVNPKEHTINFEDIKPTIKEKEYDGVRIDMFKEIAFDTNDNNEKVQKEEGSNEYVYTHPYFYVKLHKLGFNLFDRALPQGNMTINVTSGHCAGCAFEIAVDDTTKRNKIQVDDEGKLKRDENGNVLLGEPQDEQNNTTNNEVWLVLKKDTTSFSAQNEEFVYPNKQNNIVPKAKEDTFVITNILLPNEYIEAAEKRLDEELLAYMWQNNSEKFTFSIKFSRIYLAEHLDVLQKLSENATVQIKYNNITYSLYVSSFTYKVKNDEALPEIDVELTDTLTIAQNALQNALNEIKMSVISIGQANVLKTGNKYFTRKDIDDTVQGKLDLKRGANFGTFAKSRSGATITEEEGKWNIEADNVIVRDKIEGKLNVNGDLNITNGNLTIGEYEEYEDGTGKGSSIFKDSNNEWQVTSDNLKIRNKANFNKGLTAGTFVEGVADGTGAAIHGSDEKGWTIEADYLKVRRKATFNEVEIFHTQHTGGGRISSAAGCILDLVIQHELENGQRFYRCYFKKQNEQGNAIYNKWMIGDQARCETFNLEQINEEQGNHYFWRLVTGTSNKVEGTTTSIEIGEDEWVTDGEDTIFIHEYHWIDLCDTEYYYTYGEGMDMNSDAPKKGDDVFLLGHRFDTNKGRQTAIYEVAGENEVPYYRQYVGINSFSLEGCLEQQLMPNDNILSGKLVIKEGSTGWENFEGLNETLEELRQNAGESLKFLEEWVKDGIISPFEKQSIKDELVRVQATNEELSSSYELYRSAINDNVWNEYLEAYNEYTDILVDLTKDMDEVSNIPENFEDSQIAYYEKAIILTNAINSANNDKVVEALDGVADALDGIKNTNTRVDNLSISNTNLLRNSGFYGDTKSKAILGDTMMSTDTELYSPSLEYWTVSNAVAYPSDVNEEGAETIPTITDSKSGYYCKLNNGYISQIIGTALVDEDYIISFRGKGNVTIGFVGNMETVTLSDTSTRHIIRCKARTTTVNAILRIEGTGSICEIMLERGNIPSNTWNRSTLDASKELSRFRNLEYLTQAIQEGSTTMMGGLILSNILMLGNYVDGVMKQVTSGISGTYNQGDDVSYWAGGSLENAIYTATKLLKNPFYQFTEEEKKNLANAIITHGGTAIFNEAIVRGIVYATNGIFTGEVNATSGTFNNVVINENAIIKGKFNKVSQHITQENFYDFFYSNKETVYDDTNADIAEALPTRLLSWGDIIYIDSVDQTLLGASGNSFIVFPALLPFIDNKGILRHRKIYGYHKQNGEDVRLTAENVRELINREFLIINNSNANIQITSVLAKFPCEQESPTGTRTIDPYVEQIRGAESQIISQAQYVTNYIDSNNNPFGFSLNPGGALWLKYVVSETRVDDSKDLYAESIALVGLQLHCSTTEEELEEDLNT